MIKSLLILLSFFVFTFSQSQNTDPKNVEQKIDSLYQKKNIAEINDIINTNTYLDQVFVYNTLKKNIKIAEESQNGKDLSDTYVVFGSYWARVGNKIKAFDYYLKSEELSRKINDYENTGRALLGQANIVKSEKAKMEKYHLAISMFEKGKDTLNLTKTYLNIGDYFTVLATSGEASRQEIAAYKSKAFTQFQKAEKLNASFKDEPNEAILKYRLAFWENLEGKNKNAIQLFQEAEAIFKKNNLVQWVVSCQLEEAGIYYDEKNYSKSLDILRQAEAAAIQFKLNSQLLFIYDVFKTVFEKTGNYQQAYHYANLYTEVALKTKETNNGDKIQIMQLEQLSEKNKAQLELYRIESKNYKILLLAGIFIAVLCIALLFSLFQINKKRMNEIANDKIIADIHLKNNQLEVELAKQKMKFSQENLIRFANQISRIETFLDKIRNQMKSFQFDDVLQAEFNKLRLSFGEIMGNQNDLKQIQSLDSETNQNFFFYVKNNYAEVTTSEEELLAYLVKDLSSREISEILHITAESVNKKRYRLRKKLSLKKEESFQDFYKSIVFNQL